MKNRKLIIFCAVLAMMVCMLFGAVFGLRGAVPASAANDALIQSVASN
jgi:hypothetical protein